MGSLSDALIKKAHKEILDHLIGLYNAHRLPHALLFSGPYGIGKQKTALELSQVLLGAHSSGADCYQMQPETASKTYSIEQIRTLLELTSCTPYEGQRRVFILDCADRLTIQSSNAFLKLLEEPPPHNYFILISSASYKLLPTLLSRLQKITFKPLPSDELDAHIKAEGLDLGPFSPMAEGSWGKAQLIVKYKNELEALASCLGTHYLGEYNAYRQVLESFDEESFNFLEFYPLFEDLLRDFTKAQLELGNSYYPWSNSSWHPSLLELATACKQLLQAQSSGMKISSCFERFFLSLTN